jgi:transposase
MMGKANFSDDFKRDAVAQITERGYPVAEVSKRLGVSPHSLYAWKKKFSQPPGGDDKDAEIRRWSCHVDTHRLPEQRFERNRY